MPRKKKKIVSLEVLEANSLWDYRGSKSLPNFICDADDAERTIMDLDVREHWKHERNYDKEVKAILAPSGTRNASNVFYTDEVAVEEVKLPTSMKTLPKYIYKIYDYVGDKVSCEYGTQKDILSYISRKVKTKYAYVTYNGKSGRIEFSPKAVLDILNELEKTTSQFEIEPIGRSGSTEESLSVAIFKNCIK